MLTIYVNDGLVLIVFLVFSTTRVWAIIGKFNGAVVAVLLISTFVPSINIVSHIQKRLYGAGTHIQLFSTILAD